MRVAKIENGIIEIELSPGEAELISERCDESLDTMLENRDVKDDNLIETIGAALKVAAVIGRAQFNTSGCSIKYPDNLKKARR